MTTNFLIERGTTRATLHVKPTDYFASAVRQLTHYKLTDYEFTRTRYGKGWSPMRMVPTKRFLQADYLNEKLYIPINALEPLLKQLSDDYGVVPEIVDEPWITPRPISIQMIPSFEPREEQKGVIQYLIDTMIHRKGLATATGSGKTVSSIAALVQLGNAGIIIVSGLQDQWLRSIEQFTTAKPEQIYKIQGFNSIAELIGSRYRAKPEIFIGSLETIRSWVQRKEAYADLPSWYTFLKEFGIGTKIMDEVHLNFHADTMIDLNSNVRDNIYLTATFSSASTITRRIFNLIYPTTMRYGEYLREKYIDVYVYAFKGDVKESKCIRSRGYNHTRYEAELLKHPMYIRGYFNDILKPIVYLHYVNIRHPRQKLLIYFSRLDMIEYATNWFKTNFTQFKTIAYIQGVPDTVLIDNDIIVTTPKKAGCGTDIKDLRTVIQTVSCKADTVVDQSRGRLRKLPNGDTPEYVEVVDWGLQTQIRHCREREDLHRQRARNYKLQPLPGGGAEPWFRNLGENLPQLPPAFRK